MYLLICNSKTLNIPHLVLVELEVVVVVADNPVVAVHIVVVAAVDHTGVVHNLVAHTEAAVDMADIEEHKPPAVPHHIGKPVPCW